MPAPSILLIDDHAMFRSGISMVIRAALPGTKILEAASINEATSHAPDQVDLVLLDIKLNGLSGMEGIALLQRQWPLTPILMLSSLDEPQTTRLALERGAAGFVSKAETAEKIIEAILLVLDGHFDKLPPADSSLAERRLTPRQCDVLDLLHQGLSNKLIARQLSLSNNTVRRHVQDILEFFQVVSRAEAVVAARQQGLIG
ncbi:DNA-binding response regulator, NarL/FixJ family, contains REC and HTH domains [Polaromonas sp. OV174]|uniref:response regulator transcription factor n=1 Tax=Polaromonas sp. OV174 TaxID=1855300 RepID=UPI0008F2A15E|nr:response regulator transcription factor [Polaromonas sp. OV174]SFC45827.1 DNA-binding response regulator, NarL/FixJ family, contains REC and HTH domains [Polaromonas sp. OV174]